MIIIRKSGEQKKRRATNTERLQASEEKIRKCRTTRIMETEMIHNIYESTNMRETFVKNKQ